MGIKIKSLDGNGITFEDGTKIYSDHDSDCCEWHELDTEGIDFDEVKDLEFDTSLPLEELIEKVDGYGIRIKSSNNFPLSIPGYGYNNGYYSDNLTLYLTQGNRNESLDITECQEWKY